MKKITLIISVIILCVNIFLINRFVLGSWSDKNIERYVKVSESQRALPKIEALGQYNDIDFKYHRINTVIATSESYILKISYDDENYQKEKASQNYVYETRKIVDAGGYDKKPSFEMDTYNFRLLSAREYGLKSYPHELIFVGTSDEKREMAIVYYYSFELDYIPTSFQEFLQKECRWYT